MNQAMWANLATQANRALLESRGVRLIGPAEGDQACGEIGPGRMLEPLAIATALLETSGRLQLRSLAGLKVLVTAGPTREPIDPVRYITNRSSGKWAMRSPAAREAGAEVMLVSGPVALPAPAGVRSVDVETADELYAKVHGRSKASTSSSPAPPCPIIGREGRAKRSSASRPSSSSRSYAPPDTLASVAQLPSPPFTVGFAAETQEVARYAAKSSIKSGST